MMHFLVVVLLLHLLLWMIVEMVVEVDLILMKILLLHWGELCYSAVMVQCLIVRLYLFLSNNDG